MTSWRDLIPAPLAAPETRVLRAARFRVIASCVLVAAFLLFFGPLREALGRATLPLFVSAFTFAVAQSLIWVKIKNKADDAWLFRASDDAA